MNTKYSKVTLKVLKKFQLLANEQKKVFDKIGEISPYVNIDNLKLDDLTSTEMEELSNIQDKPNEILSRVNEILTRFAPLEKTNITIEDAEKKLDVKILKAIPQEECVDLYTFYIGFDMYSEEKISFKDFEWLYTHGFFPHLYWHNGHPLFYSNMWFIPDMVLRNIKKICKINITTNIRNYDKTLPNFHFLKNCLLISLYMYNSWYILKAILNYSDTITRKLGLKGENFRMKRKVIENSLYFNEGNILARNLLQFTQLNETQIICYRDTFALLAFEAFPVKYIMSFRNSKTWREWAITEVENKTLLSTLTPIEINTYKQDSRFGGYELLSTYASVAINLNKNEDIENVHDVISKYRKKENEIEIMCTICGKYFIPSRKTQVACSKNCSNENKNRRKKENYRERLRFY